MKGLLQNIFGPLFKALKITLAEKNIGLTSPKDFKGHIYKAANGKEIQISKISDLKILIYPLPSRNLSLLSFFSISPIFIGTLRSQQGLTKITGIIFPNIIMYGPFLIFIIACFYAILGITCSIFVDFEAEKLVALTIVTSFTLVYCFFISTFLRKNFFAYIDSIKEYLADANP